MNDNILLRPAWFEWFPHLSSKATPGFGWHEIKQTLGIS